MPVTISGDTGVSLVSTNAVSTSSLQSQAVTPAKMSQPLTQASSQASTSGTSIDFGSIPSWAKRVTVMFSGVSTSGAGSAALLLQVGTSSGIDSSSYASSCGIVSGSNSTGTTSSTAGFVATTSLSNATLLHGCVQIVNVTGNTWVSSGAIGSTSAFSYTSGGTKTLSGALDRVRITTTNGTDAFDAGTINILYE